MMAILIDAKKIEKRYGNDLVFKNIDIKIKKDEIIAVMGPSGVGKSTLIHILCGIDKEYKGIINRNFDTKNPVSYIPQDASLFPWKNVKKNIELILEIRRVPKKLREKKINDIIETVGLRDIQFLYPDELSGGMRQKVALAQALGNEPEIMFMDEPFSALDVQSKYNMQKLLLKLQEELKFSIFMITHDISDAVNTSDKIIIMNKNGNGINKIIENIISHPRKPIDPNYSRIHAEVSESLYKAIDDDYFVEEK